MIDPNDYWVNNPLITPANKALMYDNDIDKAKHAERERIIALIREIETRHTNFYQLAVSGEIMRAIIGENE